MTNMLHEQVFCVTVDEGEDQEEVFRRHFGEDGPPDNALVIVRQIIGPPPRATHPPAKAIQ